jgi:hypothetical protein
MANTCGLVVLSVSIQGHALTFGHPVLTKSEAVITCEEKVRVIDHTGRRQH